MEESNNNMPARSGASALPWVILAVVLLAFVIAGVLFRDRLFPSQPETTTQEEGTNSGYQAVFLTNGQVYFGKLSGMTASYATLTDIYYLQVTTPPVTNASALNQQEVPPTQQQQQLQLVKLGNELHGPVDEMKINRDQILFYEDMKEEGKVMQAILGDKNKTNQPAQQQTPTQQAPATSNTPATGSRSNQ